MLEHQNEVSAVVGIAGRRLRLSGAHEVLGRRVMLTGRRVQILHVHVPLFGAFPVGGSVTRWKSGRTIRCAAPRGARRHME